MIDKLAGRETPRPSPSPARTSRGEFDYSFSGLKTSFLYTLRDGKSATPTSSRSTRPTSAPRCKNTIIEILLDKLIKASNALGIKGHSQAEASRPTPGLRNAVAEAGRRRKWRTFIPELKFTTDNAAMIAISGYYRYNHGMLAGLDTAPAARIEEML